MSSVCLIMLWCQVVHITILGGGLECVYMVTTFQLLVGSLVV